MKALPVQTLGAACHGSTKRIGDDAKQRLSTGHPQDQGTAGSDGQIQGAVSIKRPL